MPSIIPRKNQSLGERLFWSWRGTHLPRLRRAHPAVAKAVDAVLLRLHLFRVSSVATRVLGYRWRRSIKRVSLDLTYKCNLRCFDCNRSVTQAPSSAHLTVQDVVDFLKDSREKGYHWERVILQGGEPTLHPHFLEIVDLLRAHRDNHAPEQQLVVSTNGHGRGVQAILSQLPDDVEIENSFKSSAQDQGFEPFNRAPVDSPEHAHTDFANGCYIMEYVSSSLTPQGYYHCAVAGGIDRVFELGLGRSELPAVDDQMRCGTAALCKYCGHFSPSPSDLPDDARVSESWQAAYANWWKSSPLNLATRRSIRHKHEQGLLPVREIRGE